MDAEPDSGQPDDAEPDDGQPVDVPVPGLRPIVPRWISFGLVPFLLAVLVTMGVAAYRHHQQLTSGAGTPALSAPVSRTTSS